VTPLLALFVLLDLTSFWASAWLEFQTIQVSYGLLVLGMAVAASYNFAASQVLPQDPDAWPSLDDFYARHKRFVILGVGFANVVVFDVARWFTSAGVERVRELWSDPVSAVLSYAYYVPLIGLLVSNSRRLDAILLISLVLFYVWVMVIW
jgi:hypothetical protein